MYIVDYEACTRTRTVPYCTVLYFSFIVSLYVSDLCNVTKLQIMLWGGPVATVRSRDFFVNYPVSFSLRYLCIRPISRHVCLSVCLFVGHRESSPEDTGPHEYR